MAQIDQIVEGIYRISTPPSVDGAPISFNQFLIDDEAPVLVHTGVYGEYEGIRKAISEVLDPATLAYVVLLHFEGDECGGMDRFMAGAKNAQLVGSEMSAILNLTSFGVDYVDRVKGVRDGDVIDTGRHRLKFIETPHVHHWDSMMVFEETTKSLFPSDLYIQPGDQPPVVNEDLTPEMLGFYREIGIFAHEDPVRRPSTAWSDSRRSGSTRCTAARSPARSCPATPRPCVRSRLPSRARPWAARSGSRPHRCHSGHSA